MQKYIFQLLALVYVYGMHGAIASEDRKFLGLKPEVREKVAVASSLSCDGSSKNLPISRINDDYCDCLDGSDEPGTSACSHTQSTFHCLNKGYIAKDIPTSQVNDKICDCCDGSDEYKEPKLCPNICNSLMEEYKSKNAVRVLTIKQGIILRDELLQKSKLKKEEHFRKRTDLENVKNEHELRLETAKLVKEEQEELEKLEQKNASKEQREQVSRKLGLHELSKEQLHIVIVELATKIYSKDDVLQVIKDQRATLGASLKETEIEVEEKNYLEREKEYNAQIDEINKKNDALREERRLSEEKAKADNVDYVEDEKLKDIAFPLKEERPIKLLFDQITTKEALVRKEAADARQTYSDIEREFNSAKTEFDSIYTILNTNHGQDDIFYSLRDECVESKSGQYTYKMCFFGNAYQDSISLGSMQELTNATKEIHFTGGQKCWNGPERSFKVTLECGTDSEMYGIEEPETCVYVAKLKSPIACSNAELEILSNPSRIASNKHDEL